MLKKTIPLIFLGILFSLTPLLADEFDHWRKNNQTNQKTINHQLWDDFLKKYIVTDDPSQINLVIYDKVTKPDKKKLDEYLKLLQKISPTDLNSKEQRAFWINLYNSLTIQVVLDHYPVDSIRDIKLSGIFKPGPWKKELVTIESRKLSLDNIEHNILRPIWQDNRIHYAVNCASIGCPNLQNTAFTSTNSDELLEKGAKEYVNHKRGATFKNNGLLVSSIYKWFQEDFGDSEAGVLSHLQKYANPELKTKLQAYKKSLKYDYDWSLNI